MKKLIVIFVVILPLFAQGQGIKVGVRAGLDFSTIAGPTEVGESHKLSNGFHFGINATKYFTPVLGIRAEILYQQRGYEKIYKGTGYYPIKTEAGTVFDYGNIDMFLDVSNAYISLPITLSIQATKQIEVYAGLSANFLINPVGNGSIDYTSIATPDSLFFRQSLVHQYNKDNVGGTASSPYAPQVWVDGEVVTIPGAIGAYYFFDSTKTGQRAYNSFDLSAVLGAQFYINKSFYIGTRLEYGLRDLTNDAVDTSIEFLSPTSSTFQYNADKDVQINFEASLGFRF